MPDSDPANIRVVVWMPNRSAAAMQGITRERAQQVATMISRAYRAACARERRPDTPVLSSIPWPRRADS